MNERLLVVQVLEPHILRAIRLRDCDLSENDEEEDMYSIEDSVSELDDVSGISDVSEEEDSEDTDGDDEDDVDDSDYEPDEEEEDDDHSLDERTPGEIEEECEEIYRSKRSQR